MNLQQKYLLYPKESNKPNKLLYSFR